MVRVFSFLSVLMATVIVQAKSFDTPEGPVVEVRRFIFDALTELESQDLNAEQRVGLLDAAIEQALMQLEPHSPVVEKLSLAAQGVDSKPASERLALVTAAAKEVLADLAFEPVAEAELPEGFPTYTPVGTIQLKQYPTYRMAAGTGFWTLFTHIKLNGIAMTAPVQMKYSRDGGDDWKASGMAFLYGDREIGSTGQQGKVTVLDQEKQAVVSLGVKGKRTPSVIADAQSRLQRWIDDGGKYQAAGDVRVMGYNSPYVPQDKQYFEVQIPLELAAEPAVEDGER